MFSTDQSMPTDYLNALNTSRAAFAAFMYTQYPEECGLLCGEPGKEVKIAPGAYSTGFIANNTLERLPFAQLRASLLEKRPDDLLLKKAFEDDKTEQLYAVELNRGFAALEAYRLLRTKDYHGFTAFQFPPKLKEEDFNALADELNAAVENDPELDLLMALRCLGNDFGKNVALEKKARETSGENNITHDQALHTIYENPALREKYFPNINFSQEKMFIFSACIKLSCFNLASFVQGENNVAALKQFEQAWIEIKNEAARLGYGDQILNKIKVVYKTEVRMDVAGVSGNKGPVTAVYGQQTHERFDFGFKAIEQIFSANKNAYDATIDFLNEHIKFKMPKPTDEGKYNYTDDEKIILMRLGLMARVTDEKSQKRICDAFDSLDKETQKTLMAELKPGLENTLWMEYAPDFMQKFFPMRQVENEKALATGMEILAEIFQKARNYINQGLIENENDLRIPGYRLSAAFLSNSAVKSLQAANNLQALKATLMDEVDEMFKEEFSIIKDQEQTNSSSRVGFFPGTSSTEPNNSQGKRPRAGSVVFR